MYSTSPWNIFSSIWMVHWYVLSYKRMHWLSCFLCFFWVWAKDHRKWWKSWKRSLRTTRREISSLNSCSDSLSQLAGALNFSTSFTAVVSSIAIASTPFPHNLLHACSTWVPYLLFFYLFDVLSWSLGATHYYYNYNDNIIPVSLIISCSIPRPKLRLRHKAIAWIHTPERGHSIALIPVL